MASILTPYPTLEQAVISKDVLLYPYSSMTNKTANAVLFHLKSGYF